METLRTIMETIDSIDRQDFRKKFVHNILTTSDFSAFIIDPTGVTDETKQKITRMLISAGIPDSIISSDEDLHTTARIIMDRAVHLR